MKRWICLLLTLILMIGVVPASAQGQFKEGTPAPDFTVDTTAGSFSLSGTLAKNKAVLVVFWATWCGWCDYEFPFIQSFYAKHKDQLEVVGLTVEATDTMDKVIEYQQSFGLTFPMGRDENSSLFWLTGSNGLPTSVLVDVKGTCRMVHIGAFMSEQDVATELTPWLPDPGEKPEEPEEEPQIGDAFSVSGLNYEITEKKAVCFTGLKKPGSKSKVVIPATVKYKGKSYKVTGISDEALYEDGKVTSVTIGKNVKNIGSKAFYACKKLKKIIVQTTKLTAKTLGSNAFKGIYKKAVFQCPASKKALYKKIFRKTGAPSGCTYKDL